MSGQLTVELPGDLAQEFREFSEDRANEVIPSAVREVLGLSEGDEERRNEFCQQMRLIGYYSKESSEKPQTAAEEKKSEAR